MGLCPSSTNALLVWLKHRLPMKGAFVLVAPNGLGCDVRITTCLPPALIIDCNFSAAGAPQSSNTSPLSFFLASLAKTRITSSVKFSHPFFLWLFGSPFLTVMTELSINTPCLAQFSKYPCRGIPFLPLMLPLLSRKPATVDRKSTRLNSSHRNTSRMPSSA